LEVFKTLPILKWLGVESGQHKKWPATKVAAPKVGCWKVVGAPRDIRLRRACRLCFQILCACAL